MSTNRRTLSPRGWLNRCLDAYGDLAVCQNLTLPDQDKDLLKVLGEEAGRFDSYLGTREGADEDPDEVKRSRTVLGSLKKFRDPVDGVDYNQLQSVALRKFKANNLAARVNTVPKRFVPYMKEFLSSQLADFDLVSTSSGITPRFGNGGVEEKANMVKRWVAVADQRWFDFRDPLNVTPKFDSAWHTSVMNSCCRLCAVPKDWNKLRLITVEPYAETYVQQTVRAAILHTLAQSRCGDLRALARAELGVFDPQSRHRAMALRGSVDGSLATLDLSDASDHVSWEQVCQVMPIDVLAQLERGRSTHWRDTHARATTSVEDELDKLESGEMYMFAGMGNACTFVVETMMFHAACYAIARYYGLKGPWNISVFGDDIVCATSLAELLVETDSFAEFGWTINWAKSFYTHDSRFRESCGVQAYRGKDVTLLRYMGGFDHGPNGLVGLCALLERVEELGLYSLLSSGPWPECYGIPNFWFRCASGIYTHVASWPETAGDPEVAFRWNANLQRSEVKLLHPVVAREFIRTQTLGPVYGALSGQLKQKSAVRGRRHTVSGVWIDTPIVDTVRTQWTPCEGRLTEGGDEALSAFGGRAD